MPGLTSTYRPPLIANSFASIQETHASHQLFSEIAHDFFISVLVFFTHFYARSNCAQQNRGDLANAEKAIEFLVAMLLSVPWAADQSTYGGFVSVVKDPSQGAVAKRPSLT
jgi:hypothetical protein